VANPNEQLLFAWLAAGDRGDVEEFDRYLHPEVVVHAPLGLSTTGIEAEKAVWADAKRAMPEIRHEVQETMAPDHGQWLESW
jgi:SnoaL-like protein